MIRLFPPGAVVVFQFHRNVYGTLRSALEYDFGYADYVGSVDADVPCLVLSEFKNDYYHLVECVIPGVGVGWVFGDEDDVTVIA